MFAYVRLFKAPPGCSSVQRDTGIRKHVADDDSEMYRVVRDLDADGVQRGRVIDVRSIWRPVQLIPVFGPQCPSRWTSSTAVDVAPELYVNCFADKATYNSVI